MKLLLLFLLAAMGLTARAQEVSAIMQNGPLRFTDNPVLPDGQGLNLRLYLYMQNGSAFGVRLGETYEWNNGPANATSVWAAGADFVFDPGSGMNTWILGDLRVGMGNWGGRNLRVLGTIYQGADEQPVPRWLGELSSDPADPRGGDQYFNTSTSKARLFTGSAWIDLN